MRLFLRSFTLEKNLSYSINHEIETEITNLIRLQHKLAPRIKHYYFLWHRASNILETSNISIQYLLKKWIIAENRISKHY